MIPTSIQLSARDTLWRMGNLQWKLDRGAPNGPQRRIYDHSKSSMGKTFVTEAARRLGKTYVHALIAVELALQNPGCKVNWAQDTSKSVRDAAVPLFNTVCEDAPEDCKGRFNDHRSAFVFPNGSYIFLFGSNTQEDADRARGGIDPIASFVDEAGFCEHLEYVYRSILKPAMRLVGRVKDTHRGVIFLSSSTPYTPAHYFRTIAKIREDKGSYFKATIYEDANAEQYIAEEAEDLNLSVDIFKQTVQFKREFMCESVVDTNVVVFPEFYTHQEKIVRSHPRPMGFDAWIHRRIAIDLGMSDKTGILYGYTDFVAGKVIIEAETLLSAPNTKQIAETLTKDEAILWPNCNPRRVARVCDDPHGRVIKDLLDLHHIYAEKATKHDRNASIGLIRSWIQQGRILINPSCQELIKQLTFATSNKAGNDFTRTAEGHSDLAAALMYFIRDININSNPYPHDFDKLTGRKMADTHPLKMRREEMAKLNPRPKGIAGALLGRNAYVSGINTNKKR